MDEHREVIYPAIYRHFKQKFYATMGISTPKDTAFLNNISQRDDCEMFQAHDTEDEITMIVYKLNGSYYHNTSRNHRLVLYKSLYDDTGIYARPYDMFAGLVDKDKYPDTTQKYRFDLVRIFG